MSTSKYVLLIVLIVNVFDCVCSSHPCPAANFEGVIDSLTPSELINDLSNIPFGGSSRTISFWFNAPETFSESVLLSMGAEYDCGLERDQEELAIQINPESRTLSILQGPCSSAAIPFYSLQFDWDQWTYVALVYSAVTSLLRLYVNELSSTVEYPVTLNTGNAGVWVGFLNSGRNRAFHGSISTLRFYSTYLFPAQIQNDYLGIRQANLTGEYFFISSALGDEIYDSVSKVSIHEPIRTTDSDYFTCYSGCTFGFSVHGNCSSAQLSSEIHFALFNTYAANIPGLSRYGLSGVYDIKSNSIIIGGGIQDSHEASNSVYVYTNESVSWQTQTDAAPWAARYGSGWILCYAESNSDSGDLTYSNSDSDSAVPYIIAVGGASSIGGLYKDVWRSADLGKSWEQLPDIPFLETGFSDGVLVQATPSYILLVAAIVDPIDPTGIVIQAWISPDVGGSFELTESPPWSSVGGAFSIVELQSGLLACGITNINGCYSSQDGVYWTLVTAPTSPPPFYDLFIGNQMVALGHGNSAAVVSGCTANGTLFSDFFHVTYDGGVSWTSIPIEDANYRPMCKGLVLRTGPWLWAMGGETALPVGAVSSTYRSYMSCEPNVGTSVNTNYYDEHLGMCFPCGLGAVTNAGYLPGCHCIDAFSGVWQDQDEPGNNGCTVNSATNTTQPPTVIPPDNTTTSTTMPTEFTTSSTLTTTSSLTTDITETPSPTPTPTETTTTTESTTSTSTESTTSTSTTTSTETSTTTTITQTTEPTESSTTTTTSSTTSSTTSTITSSTPTTTSTPSSATAVAAVDVVLMLSLNSERYADTIAIKEFILRELPTIISDALDIPGYRFAVSVFIDSHSASRHPQSFRFLESSVQGKAEVKFLDFSTTQSSGQLSAMELANQLQAAVFDNSSALQQKLSEAYVTATSAYQTQSTTTPPTQTSSEQGISTVIMVAIGVGAVLVIIFLIVAAIYCTRGRRRSGHVKLTETMSGPESDQLNFNADENGDLIGNGTDVDGENESIELTTNVNGGRKFESVDLAQITHTIGTNQIDEMESHLDNDI